MLMTRIVMPKGLPFNSSEGTTSSREAEESISQLAGVVQQGHCPTGMVPLSANYKPGEWDVICARGKLAKNHAGNVRYRNMVAERVQAYDNAATRVDKSVIVSSILDGIREKSPEGGFVKEINGQYFEVGDVHAREKIGQSLRDMLHTKYSSSTQAKKIRRNKGVCIPFVRPTTSTGMTFQQNQRRTLEDVFKPLDFMGYGTGHARINPPDSVESSFSNNDEEPIPLGEVTSGVATQAPCPSCYEAHLMMSPFLDEHRESGHRSSTSKIWQQQQL